MAKPKVIFLGKLPPPYIGPAVATRVILNSKLKDVFELIHLDLSDHRDIDTLGKFDFTNFYLAFKQYFNLIRLILKHKPDLVYIPVGQTTVSYCRDSVFILIAKVLGYKVLCHLRGGNFKNWYHSSNKIVKWWVRFVHRKVDGQVVLGNNLRHLFNWLLPQEKIFVVPNGADYSIPGKSKSNDKIRVLYLGNFVGSKGVLEVLKASVILCEKVSDIEFFFSGQWSDEKTKIEFFKILDQHPGLPVIVTGTVIGQQKFELLASADIFVFPTYYPNEGHPWVIVEAMAAGLPIITTDHGAISESVIDGKNGFLVEKKKPGQIADKIRFLIDNPGIRERMGDAGKKYYLEKFTGDKMVESLFSAFIKTMGRCVGRNEEQ